MFRSFLLLVLFFILASEINAQILDVEKSRLDKDSSNAWNGKASLNLSMFNSNVGADSSTVFVGFSGTANIAYVSNRHSYMLFNAFNYVSLRKEIIVKTGYAHFRINFNRKDPISYETFTQAQFDPSRGLIHRYLVGGDLRFRLLKSQKMRMFIGTGIMYENEKWQNLDDESIITKELPKFTSFFSFGTNNENALALTGITYFQTGYDPAIAAFRNRMSFEYSVLSRFHPHWRLKTSFIGAYENLPVMPITKFLYNITTGLQFDF